MDGSIETNPYIDSSVGALVWVRRRNGSWWPGRILGPEELPGSHLLSPRTGTPVKLLGREDGSVDWYNIEKSRRVKAFRCGEFDECIERAKSLASVLTKKREKYARREDAILHALELEKKHIEKNCQLLEAPLSLDRGFKHIDNFPDDDMVIDDMDGMANHSDFQSDFVDPESSPDAPQASLDSLFSLQGDKKFLDGDWEDDITDTLPRMRGLQDFGLKIDPSKDVKTSWGAEYEDNPHLPIAEDEKKIASCITKNAATCSMPISSKTSSSVGAISKRKRSAQPGHLEDEGSLKKRDRRKSLTSGLESCVKVGEGAPNSGIKASVQCLISGINRNGGVFLQPKQENDSVLIRSICQGSSEMKSLTSACGSDFWPATQMDSIPKHEMLYASSMMDKECSSFSDHIRSNCCDGRQYLYNDSQVDIVPLTGPSFPDPFLQGVTGSRSSLFQRSVYSGSYGGVNDNGFPRATFLSTADTTPVGFSMWPYHSHKEVPFEKFSNDLGLRGQIASSRQLSFSDYSFDSTVPNAGSPMYSLYNNPTEDNSACAKGIAGDREGLLLSPKGNPKADILIAPHRSPKQCMSDLADGVTNEDEADSFQSLQDSVFCSPKAIGSRDTYCSLEVKNASDCDDLWDDGLDEDVDVQDYTIRSRSYICNGSLPTPTLSSWQTKGRRGMRVRCGTSWVSHTGGATLQDVAHIPFFPHELSEVHEDVEMATKRATRGFRYSFNFDSSSEEEPSNEKCNSQPVHKGRSGHKNMFETQSAYSFDGLEVPEPSWFEIPVEEDQIRINLYHEHAPQVSMMSMLKGKPIVGYAVHIEVLEKKYRGGQYDGGPTHSSGDSLKKSPLQPVWRTGRRTAMQRIPRSCGMIISRDFERERQRHLKHYDIMPNRAMKKNGFLTSASAEKRKSLKKLGLAPQKTRMLSSIAVPSNEEGAENDATKREAPPLVTCIPVSVIFNRIREALYGGVNHGASDSDNIS
ncbi:hypothetical protein KP509_26G018500 [Ceratopteris richardii]|uniref:PWWP domain-containing protein n=2 Tax=Ceratopteris richardii TaxID=49495 RepID=A0A8T2RLA8_CERRI|nr:hypothetical protein KP509_26G018500 [Ceratopteris richardii]